MMAGLAAATRLRRAHRAAPAQTADQQPEAAASILPDRYTPPPVTDPRLTAFVDRQRPVEERLRADITSSLPAVTDETDVAAVIAVLTDTQDIDDVRNEAANLLRRSGSPQLASALIGIVNHPTEKERFRAFAIQHLGLLAQDAVDEEAPHAAHLLKPLREALQDRHIAVRREALLALSHLNDPLAVEVAGQWLYDLDLETARVHDVAIRCLREQNQRVFLPMIRDYARHAPEPVRIAALVTLSEWNDAESRDAFVAAAQADAIRLRRAGQAALDRLDRTNATPKPTIQEP